MQVFNKNELYQNLNEGIICERYRAFQINLNKNLPLIKKHGGIHPLVHKLHGKHICILGAGPSLECCYSLLKKYQHRHEIALLAVDMAFLPLYHHGIVPEYVISCETTPIDYFANATTEKSALIAFSCMASSNLRRWKGAIYFYNWMINGIPYDDLWDKAGRHLGFIATGNLVTTQAIALAFGCKPASIFIVGNDLAFSRSYYVKGTVFHRIRLRSITRFTSMESAEQQLIRKSRNYELLRGNDKYYTNHQFLAAKTWLEDLCAKTAIPVYDASEPGLSGKYVTKMSANAYFAQFERRNKRRKK